VFWLNLIALLALAWWSLGVASAYILNRLIGGDLITTTWWQKLIGGTAAAWLVLGVLL